MRRIENPSKQKTMQNMANALQDGFSRAHGAMLRPDCPTCVACKPIRIPLENYEPRRSHRRLLRLNRTLDITEHKGLGGRFFEHFDIFKQWTKQRHNSDRYTDEELRDNLYHNSVGHPVAKKIFEFRDWMKDDRLLGASICTLLPLQKIAYGDTYYFDPSPEFNKRSLGITMNVMMLQLLQQRGYTYLHFGDWTAEKTAYHYKSCYTDDAEIFDKGRWLSLKSFAPKPQKQTP